MINVPLLDLKAQYRIIREEVRAAVDDVLKSQHFILGPQVSKLEEAVAAHSGCGFGAGDSSGSDALPCRRTKPQPGAHWRCRYTPN